MKRLSSVANDPHEYDNFTAALGLIIAVAFCVGCLLGIILATIIFLT